MVKIYTTPTCSSCRKAKKWLDEHKIAYQEISLLNAKLSNDDLNGILKNAENGVEDIISMRSKYLENTDIENMTITELKSFIIEHPLVLRRPIIVGDDRMQVGYNEEDIEVFMPKRLRELLICASCDSDAECDYKTVLAKYLDEVRKQIREEKNKWKMSC